MRTLKLIIIAGLCAWLMWGLFAAVFLTHCSGKTGYGGFPMADRNELHDSLTSRGFALAPASPQSNNAQPQERFRGTFHGSRPFFVTISTKTADTYGVYVETAYDFRGFTWSVDDSSKKAQEFADTLNRWLTERRMRSLNTRP